MYCMNGTTSVPKSIPRYVVDKVKLQWGSEYRTSLVFEWLKVVRSPNGPLFECHLNTRLSFVRYSDHHLNTGPVRRTAARRREEIKSV